MKRIADHNRPKRIYTIWRRIPSGVEILTPHGPVALNETGGLIWEMLDGLKSITEILANLQAVFPDTDQTTLRSDALELLHSLTEQGLAVVSWPPDDWRG